MNDIIINNPGRAEQVRKAHHDLVRPIVAQDRMYRISNTGILYSIFNVLKLCTDNFVASGSSVNTFDAAGAATKAWLEERWAYLASMFHVNGHGNCDHLGQCTCHDNYFGAKCGDCMSSCFIFLVFSAILTSLI